MASLVETILASGEVDALLFMPVATGVTDSTFVRGRHNPRSCHHLELPVLMVPLGGLRLPKVEGPRATVYRTTASTVRCLSRAARYAQWLAAPRVPDEPVDAVARRAAQLFSQELLSEVSDDGWLPMLPAWRSWCWAVARLTFDVGELSEFHLNPVMFSGRGCAVVDVKMRLVAPSGPDPSAPRQRRPAPESQTEPD